MGLKKFIKKITKPISKVLDKVVPNEIKPLLPYAAAFAPYLLPAGGAGILGSMAGRAMVTGGLNIGSQLAQEGSEGEFSGLSALLAALQGAGTAQGAGSTLRGMKNPGVPATGTQIAPGVYSDALKGGFDTSGLGALDKAKNFGLEFAAKGADALGKAANTLQNNPFSMSGLKAAAMPASLATGDLAMSQARLAMKDWEEGEALRMAAEGADNEAYDAARRSAVIASLQAYGYVENEINDTLSQLGMQLLAKGGRVGFALGGGDFSAPDFMTMGEVVENVNDDEMEEGIMEIASAKNRIKQLYEQIEAGVNVDESMAELYQNHNINLYNNRAMGGMINSYNMGGSVLPQGMEMDYRGGGMIPMGTRERADDVPARVSKNEFVMTADAVRAAGGGSVNKGAQRMYNLMHNLEARA